VVFYSEPSIHRLHCRKQKNKFLPVFPEQEPFASFFDVVDAINVEEVAYFILNLKFCPLFIFLLLFQLNIKTWPLMSLLHSRIVLTGLQL